ncbi:MAG: succinylglutamate desuccinylase/aspartoacylase family protein [bacterium]
MLKLITNSPIESYTNSENPELLIISGMHGDEFSIINDLRDFLKENIDKLPPCLFIPEASPTAVKAQTRKNSNENDLNRSFSENTDDLEASRIIKQLNNYHFNNVFSFHEDLESDAFYFYTSQRISSKILDEFRNDLINHDISLFSGIDDQNDPTLSNVVKDGYIYEPFSQNLATSAT